MGSRLAGINVPRFPLLSDEEAKELLKRAKDGDAAAREKLVNCNLKLVFNLVRRFSNRGIDLEDLFQIGCIGLMKAIDKFDMSYNVKFSTYAVPMIVGEIRRFLRDDGPLKVSRSTKEAAHKIQQVREMLTARLGREPSVGEVALELGVSREEVVSALEAVQSPASIYETLHQEDGDPIYLLDHLKSKELGEGGLIESLCVKEILGRLPARDRLIITWRFFEDRTQSDIAQKLGLSQVQVSRLERQALKKLKDLMEGGTV